MIALILKATLILIAGRVATLILYRRSAALRHLVWTVTLAASVLLLLVTPVLPTLPLRVLPAARESVVNVINVSAAGRLGGSAAEPSTSENPLTPAAREIVRRISTADQLMSLWILGILAISGWCVLGRLGLGRLLRRSTPLEDPEWNAELNVQRATNNVQRSVRLFLSDRVGSPVTWSVRRPVIVLPPEAREWSAERRKVVLAHELAHIARGDGIANLIAWAGTAVYWFHPLAWFAAKRLRAESERAADDLVLSQGVSPFDYAAHLLDVARGSRWLRLQGATAIGMARPHTLEGRLLAVLDSNKNRLSPRRLTRRATWMLSAGFVLPFAALIPTLKPAPFQEPVRVEAREPAKEPTVVLSTVAHKETQRADSAFEDSFAARSGGTLVLDLQTGAEVRVEGWDESRVQIRGVRAGRNWRETLVMMGPSRDPEGIRLVMKPSEPIRDYSSSHRVQVMVPRVYDVRLKSAGGGVTIVGVEGDFSGTTGGGEITIERAKGRAELSTGGGDIRVRASTLDGRVSTGGGEVLIDRVQGGLRASSGSGPVMYSENEKGEKGDIRAYTTTRDGRVSVSANEVRAGVIHVIKAGGDIDLERAPEGAEIRTGGGEVRVGESAGRVHAQTGGGDMTIGPVDGSVEATTGAGKVEVRITDSEGSVRVNSGNGAAVIIVPEDFNGRFELETAYTRSHGRTKIVSDFELSRSETDEWDESQGTPRKFVRASGRVGNGPGVIRVRITNGDITIRRR